MMNSSLGNLAIERRRGVAGLSRTAAVMRAWCQRTGLAVWRGLESYGQRRALLELHRLGCRFERRDPELASQAREAGRFIASRDALRATREADASSNTTRTSSESL